MAEKVLKPFVFREKFRVLHKQALLWFPGHMGKGLKQMQQKLKLVDCVIEVHDARIPLSGRNPNFQYTISGAKPHILVMNKKDLIDRQKIPIIENVLKKSGNQHVLFTDCKDDRCSGVRQIVPMVTKLISSCDRFNRKDEKDYCIMVIGVPNVGKSSLINRLRNKHLGKANAAPVGSIAGVTRSVQFKIKVSENPLIYLLDTPGILTPNIPNNETGLRLSLCACLQDHLVGHITIADYLLFWLNKNSNFRYLDVMSLDEPSDNIEFVLTKCALTQGKVNKIRNIEGGGYVHKPDLTAAATHFIKAFRNVKLGKLILDDI